MWRKVAPALCEHFLVVVPDLRGYGDSDKPSASADFREYAKRSMAADIVAIMRSLGHDQFQVAGHDRGGRVAHRLAVDFPACVQRLMLLDIAPTLAMYQHTSEAFAKAYWHWFFLIQAAPLPERLIEADPLAYLRDLMLRRAGPSVFSPEAWFEYERCALIPGTATSMCEDYRAAATIDLDHDRADRAAGRRVSQPLRVLWGAQGTVAKCFDVLALWREVADQVAGKTLDCGHYIAEERPSELLAEMLNFFNPNEGVHP